MRPVSYFQTHHLILDVSALKEFVAQCVCLRRVRGSGLILNVSASTKHMVMSHTSFRRCDLSIYVYKYHVHPQMLSFKVTMVSFACLFCMSLLSPHIIESLSLHISANVYVYPHVLSFKVTVVSCVCLFCISLLHVSFASAYHRVYLSTCICKYLRISTHTLFQSHNGLFCMSLLYISFVSTYHGKSPSTYICKYLRISTNALFLSHSGLFCMSLLSPHIIESLSYKYLQICTYIHTCSRSISIKYLILYRCKILLYVCHKQTQIIKDMVTSFT